MKNYEGVADDWNSIRLGTLRAWAQTEETVRVRYASPKIFEEERTGPMTAQDALTFAWGVVNDGGVLTGIERVRTADLEALEAVLREQVADG